MLSRLTPIKASFCSNISYVGRRLRLSMSENEIKAMSSSSPSSVGAGLIIIGDEILNGSTQDVNTSFIATNLRSMGVQVKRVSIIPDDVEVIAEEMRSFSDKYDVVITSGGIGPTHDDKTFEALAQAFEDRLEVNAVLGELVSKYFTGHPNMSAMKLATIPSKSILHFGRDPETGDTSKFPVVNVSNVFVFPGIPQLLRKAIVSQGEKLFGQLSKQRFHTKALYVDEYETSIAEHLNSVLDEFQPNQLTLGSYPELDHNYFKVKIVIESNNESVVEKAEQMLKERLPSVLLHFDPHPEHNAMAKIERLLEQNGNDESFVEAIREAQSSVAECFHRYKADEVFVCFNGGKDCIAMLHLVHAFFEKHVATEEGGKSEEQPRLHALYIRDSNPFAEVEELVEKVFEADHVVPHVEEGPSMKKALGNFLRVKPNMKAAIMGTRRADPHGHKLQHFAPTDGDWPELMRVLPILGLEYSHVWKLIRELSLPYPLLYDKGFTSLGAAHDTKKNEALRYVDEEGKEHYRPAYMLDEHHLERAGRTAASGASDK